MANTYEIDITREQRKTVRLSVRDDIPEGEVRKWAKDNVHDLLELEDGEARRWDGVDDLVDGEIVTVVVECLDEVEDCAASSWGRV
jgi:hypothetical protein